MAGLALKLIENTPFFKREVAFNGDNSGDSSHSLHYGVRSPGAIKPEVAAYLIEEYSKKGDTVLDAFSTSGVTALEACLRGRQIMASDVDPLSVRITNAKLSPVDIAEVTLKLQLLQLRRPVSSNGFRERFEPFYDLESYRELVNLRDSLEGDRVSRFIELLVLGLLHGHTAGYISGYSLPHISLSPEQQHALNLKRRQYPEYRAVVPRILRKAAIVLRDGLPSVLERSSLKSRATVSDPRDLHYVEPRSIRLAIGKVPLFSDEVELGVDPVSTSTDPLWLERWFAKLPRASRYGVTDSDAALDFMNQHLFELTRVVAPTGRAVFELSHTLFESSTKSAEEEMIELVERCFGRFWDVEGVITPTVRTIKIKDTVKSRQIDSQSAPGSLLVLRRR